jgi:3-hydroxyisobutyrate dehydrogenase-like beta-hydroxyacid dehydrogenase
MEVIVSKAPREKTIGFVGLGAMGGPMARNILKAGHSLVVYDLDARKNAQFADLGAQVADGPANVARCAGILISMVDTSAQAQAVIVGQGGFIEAARAGDVIVSMSTIDPEVVRDMHRTRPRTAVLRVFPICS